MVDEIPAVVETCEYNVFILHHKQKPQTLRFAALNVGRLQIVNYKLNIEDFP